MAKSNSETMALGSATGLAIAGGMVFAALATPALAQIEGPQVVGGSASIQRQGSLTTIHAADNTIINYGRFDIRAGETVRFIQPDAFSRVLNRITSPEPTRIDGSLIANGQVYLVNPAGMVFGPGSVIDVGGIFAAAAHMSDQDFLRGVDRFTVAGGEVVNYGSINASFAALVGRYVANYGSIDAMDGFVTMAAGDEVYIGKLGGVLYARVQAPVPQEDGRANITNAGDVRATRVNMASGDLLALAITGGSSITGEEVRLEAGSARVSGTIDASSDAGTGGRIEVLADLLVLDRAVLDVSGYLGGGTILVGGEYRGGAGVPTAWRTAVSRGTVLNADALHAGDGGRVIVWADDATWFSGHISARGGAQGGNGGFVEVSGKDTLFFHGTADTSAPRGGMGQLLLDPATLTITDAAAGGDHDGDLPDILAGAPDIGGNTVSWGAIDALAATTDIVLEATGLVTVANVTGAAGGAITAADLVLLDLTTGSLTIRSTGGAVTFADAADEIRTEGGDITIEALGGAISAGRLNTSGAAGTAAGGAITLTAADDVSADTLTTSGGIVMVTGDAITLNDISTVGASGTAAGGDITIAGTAGEVVTVGGAITVAGAAVSITGDEINLGGAISSRAADSTLELAATSANIATRLAGGATAGLDLTAAELDLIAEAGGADVAWESISIGSDASTAALVVVNDYTFASNLVESDADSFIVLRTGGTATLTIDDDNALNAGNNSLLLRADEINIDAGGSVAGTGALVFEPNSTGDAILLAAPAGGGANVLDLTLNELQRIDDGFSSITFGRSDGTGTLTLSTNTSSYIFTDAVLFVSPGGSIVTLANFDATGAATFDGDTTLGANITTGGAVTFTGDVTLSANAEVDAAANAITFPGDVDLAGFTLTVGSSGVTFTGMPQLGGTLLATGDPVEFQAAVTLGAATSITASTLEFQDDLDLDGFTLTATTTGGVTFTGMPQLGGTLLSSGQPVEFQGDVALGAATNITASTLEFQADLDLNGFTLAATTTGGVSFTAPVQLGGTLTASGQAIEFQGTITLGANTTITGDSIDFQGDVDLSGFDLTARGDEIDITGGATTISGTGGGDLTLRPEAAATTVEVGGASAGAGLDLLATELAKLDASLSSVSIETGATGTMNVRSAPGLASPLTLESATAIVIHDDNVSNNHDFTFDGPVSFDASLGAGPANISALGTDRTLSFASTVTGNAGLDVNLTADEIDLGGAVSATGGGEIFLKPDSDIDVDLGGATSATSSLLEIEAAELALISGFSRTVVGDNASTSTLTVVGAATFATPGVLRSGTGDIQIDAAVTLGAGGSNSQLIADDIDINAGGSVLGSGTLVIFPATTTLDVDLAGSGIGGLELTAAEISKITGTFTNVAFGRSGITPNVGIGAAMPSLASPVEFRAATAITLFGTYSNGDDITFSGPVVVDATATVSAGSTIDFNSTLDVGTNDLDLQAGEVDFGGAVSGTGTLSIRPDLATIFVVLGGSNNATSDLDLTDAELDQIGSTFTLVRFGVGTLTSGVTLTADRTFGMPIELLGGTGTVAINADLAMGGNALRAVADAFDIDTVNGAITGSGGTLTIEPQTASRNLRFGGANTAGTLALSNAEIARLSGTFSSFTFGRADGTGSLTIPSAVDLTGASVALPLTFETGTGTINAIAGLTNPDDITFAGPASLGADVFATGASLSFDNAVTLSAAAEVGGALVDFGSTLAAGANDATVSGDEIDFAAGVSGTGDLVLRTEAAGRPVEVGGAAPNAAALSLVATELDLLADGWNTITIGRADSTAALTFAGPYTFNTGLTVNGLFFLGGTGSIDIANAVDVGANPVTLIADDIVNTAGITGTSTFAAAPQGAGVGIDIGSPTISTGGLDLSDADLAAITGFSLVTIGDATARPIRIDTATIGAPTTILTAGAGTIVVEDDASPGLAITGALTLGGSGVSTTLGANILAHSISIPGNTIIADGRSVVLNTSAQNGAITLGGTTDGTAGGSPETLAFNAGGGDVSSAGLIAGAAGAASATGLTTVTFTSADAATLAGTAISGPLATTNPFGGTFTSSASLGAGSINLSGTIFNVNGGFATAGNASFTNSGLWTLGADSTSGGSTTVNGAASLGANATSTGDMTFQGPVTLGQNVTLTVNGGSGNDLLIVGPVDGTTAGFQALSADTNGGTLTIQSPVGATTPLSTLNLVGNGISIDDIGLVGTPGVVLSPQLTAVQSIDFTGDVYHANGQTYSAGTAFNLTGGAPVSFISGANDILFQTGALSLGNGSNLSITTAGGDIAIANLVGHSGEDVLLNAGAGGITLGNIGNFVGVRAFTATGSTITLNGFIETGGAAGNNVTLNGGIILGTNVTIDTDNPANDGAVVLNGPVNATTSGVEGLIVTSGSAATSFQDDVGATPLASLNITAGTINLLNVTTAGAQTYTGTANLGGDLTSSGGDITLAGAANLLTGFDVVTGGGDFLSTGPIDGAQAFVINAAGGSATLQGVLGGVTPLASTNFAASTIEIPAVTTSGGQVYTGVTGASGQVTSAGGLITFAGNVTLRNSIVINTAADNAGAGANLLFTNAINSATGNESLTIGTGTAGGTTVAGAIGTASPLSALSIAGATLSLNSIGGIGVQGVTGLTNVSVGNATFSGNIFNAGAQNYTANAFSMNAGSPTLFGSNGQNLAFNTGDITLAAGTDLNLNTGNAGDLLVGNVQGTLGQDFTATAGGILTFGNIGGGAQIADITIAGNTINGQAIIASGDFTATGNGTYGSGLTIGGNANITGDSTFGADISILGNATITGNTILGQSIAFTSGPTSVITFGGDVDGTTAGADAFTFGGGPGVQITFSGGIGQSVRLGDLAFGGLNALSLAATRAANLIQNADASTSTFGAAIDLTGNASLRGVDFSFQGPISAGGTFALDADGSVSFQGNTTIGGAFTQTGSAPTVFIRGDHTAASYAFAAPLLSLTGATSLSTAATGADLDLPRLGSSGQQDLTLAAGTGDLILDDGIGTAGDPLGSLTGSGADIRLGAVGTPLANGVTGALVFNFTGNADLVAALYRAQVQTFNGPGAGTISFSGGAPTSVIAPGGAAYNSGTVALGNGVDLSIDTSGGNGTVVLPNVTGVSHEALAVTAGSGAVTLGQVGSNSANQIRILDVTGGILTLMGGIFTSDFDGNRVALTGSAISLGADVTIDTVNTTFDGRIALSGPIDGATAGGQSLTIDAGTKTSLALPVSPETEPETSLESTLFIDGSIGATNAFAGVSLSGRLIHLIGDTDAIRSTGDVSFNGAGRAAVADHATIIRYRRDGVGGVSTTQANLAVDADGNVIFGAGHKVVVLGNFTLDGLTNARAASATLTDIVSLGAMTVRADTIGVQGRGPAQLQTVDVNALPPFDFVNPLRIEDDGPDFISASNINFEFATSSDITTALFATNAAGTVLGQLATQVTPFVYEPTFSASDIVQTRLAGQSRFLDLRAQGNPDLNIAETVAASIPRETRTNEVSEQASISAADQQDLTRLGVTVKTSEDLVGMLQSPFLILVDMPNDLSGASSGVSAQRLARTPVVDAVDSFYLLMYENLPTDPDTGRPLRDANGAVVVEGSSGRSESIQRGLQDAYTAYQGTLQGVDPDPQGFLAYIQSSTLDQARADIASLSALFVKIDNLGLTPAEADQSKDYILRLVRRPRGGVPADLLRGVIEAWSQQ